MSISHFLCVFRIKHDILIPESKQKQQITRYSIMTHNPITNTTLPNDAIHNIQALAAYISHNLHTVLYQIDLSGNILASYCDIPDFSDTFISSVSISDYVNQCVRDKIPLFFSYNDICYALVCPSSQDFGFLLGPFQISSPVRLCHANSGSQYDVSVFSDFVHSAL